MCPITAPKSVCPVGKKKEAKPQEKTVRKDGITDDLYDAVNASEANEPLKLEIFRKSPSAFQPLEQQNVSPPPHCAFFYFTRIQEFPFIKKEEKTYAFTK